MIDPLQIPCPGGFLYTVRAGDTLFGIARRYGLTYETLLQANPDLDPAQNPGADPNRLVIGQRVCIPIPPPTTCPGTIYTIVAGDTLFSIAARFNTTVQEILAANPGIDPNRLFIGQQICIPTAVPPTCPGSLYTIVAGDTLFAIAQRFGTTVQAILDANPGLDPTRLTIGQQICIPVPQPPVCPGFVYTVRAGDTIFALAARYNTTVQAILDANPGLDPTRLTVGQQICIPVQQPPPTPTCPGFIYTIRAGDTLYILAGRYNTTVQAILDANPGIDPNNLQIGQQICIPVPQPPVPPTPTCPGFIYTIRAGDTLYILAGRYNTTVQAIQAANPGIDPNNLQVGQEICIPVPAQTAEAETRTSEKKAPDKKRS